MNEWAKMAYDQEWLDQQPSDVWEVVNALKQQLTLENEMKGYYMMITVKEDCMGNLHLAPVSDKHSQELIAMHNQAKVFAQEGMQFHREILERLPENAIKNMQGGWTATTRVPIDLFYHWVEFCAWS